MSLPDVPVLRYANHQRPPRATLRTGFVATATSSFQAREPVLEDLGGAATAEPASFFLKAQNTNASHSTFTSAGRDVLSAGHDIYNNTYVNHPPQEDRILATLKPISREGHYVQKCMDGTREGILKDIGNWLDDLNTSNILWISGSPGAGKSAVASTLVSKLHQQGRLASSIFFQRGDALLSDPAAVWRTVAFDLAKFDPAAAYGLVMVLQEQRVDPGRADIHLHFDYLIEEVMTLHRTFKKNEEALKRNEEALANNKEPLRAALKRREEMLQKVSANIAEMRQRAEERREVKVVTKDGSVLNEESGWQKNLEELEKQKEALEKQREVPELEQEVLEMERGLLEKERGTLTAKRDGLYDRRPVIVLDALDECGFQNSQTAQRHNLLETLTGWSRLPKGFKLIVTSRDDRLPKAFRSVCHQITLPTGDIVSSEAAHDIRLFLERRLANIAERHPSLPPDWPGESIIQRLTTDAAGLFVWADTVMRYIERGIPSTQLTLILAGHIHKGDNQIDKLYQQILELSFEDINGQILEAFHAVLGAIILAKVPLRRCDLKHFIGGQEEDAADFILDKLSSVISQGDGVDVLRINHLSFAEFLCGSSLCPGHFIIDRTLQSRRLAFACLRLMKDGLKFNICGLETSHLCNDDIPDLSTRISHLIPSSLSYSSRFWAEHLRDAPHEEAYLRPELLAEIDNFLHIHFLHWLEVMSLINEVSTAVGALLYTGRWIRDLDPELSAFAADARRFVVSFRVPITASAPHIYLSALPWSPRGSRIAMHFLPQFPQTLSVTSGQATDWSSLINVLIGHGGSIEAVGFLSDGKHIISCARDKTIRVWDAETGQMVSGPFEGHSAMATSVGFSPDGKRVVSGSRDKMIRIWDAETGQIVSGPLEGHSAAVTSVTFSPSGEHVATGSRDKTIRVWHVGRHDKMPNLFNGHSSSITSVRFSPDGMYVVSGSDDKTIRIWDIETGQLVSCPFKGHTEAVTCVAFSPDGKRVISGSRDKTIRIWNVEQCDLVSGPFEGHLSAITSIEFSPNGKYIASGSEDKTIRIWDAETGQVVSGPFGGHSATVTSVGFSPNGELIVSGSCDKTICVWDAKISSTGSGFFTGHSSAVTSVGFSPNGKFIVSGSKDRTIRLWDTETGQQVSNPYESPSTVTLVGFSADGTHVISSSSSNTVHAWEVQTGRMILGPFEGLAKWHKPIGLSRSGMNMPSGLHDDMIRLRDTTMGHNQNSVGHTNWARSAGFSPDGTKVVSGLYDRTMRIWDAKNGRTISAPFRGHSSLITSVVFSPDGRRVLSGSWDNTVRIWDAQTTEMILMPLRGHAGHVTAVGFSPDGNRIISGSDDSTILIWDAETGQIVSGPLKGHAGRVTSVQFSSDGNRIVSGSDDGTIRIWYAGSSGNFDCCHMRISEDGWMTTDDLTAGVAFWVPFPNRGSVCGTDPTIILNRSMTRINLTRFAHGQSWVRCHLQPTSCTDLNPTNVTPVCPPDLVITPQTESSTRTGQSNGRLTHPGTLSQGSAIYVASVFVCLVSMTLVYLTVF